MSLLRYRVSGPEGHNILLLLHGFLGSSGDWSGLVESLFGYRPIVPDLPGHGGSVGLPPKSYTMEGAADALIKVLDETDTEECHVVGYSMGGRLALYLALRHPERVSSLLLESSSPGLKTDRERKSRRHADEEKARRLEIADETGFAAFLGEWHRQPLFASLARHKGLVEKLTAERRNNDPVELAKSLRGIGTGSQPSLWGELPGLQAPTLAVVGELDEKFVGVARQMAESSPNIECVVVGGAGHNVHIESEGEYTELLKQSAGGG